MIRIPVTSILSVVVFILAAAGAHTKYSQNLRPQAHFTPHKGWMNDPNGLFYDKTEQIYHLYFQFSPNKTFWDIPLYWGHATSPDLVHWEEHDIAISPESEREAIYSGSIVVDEQNTSGLFDESIDPHQRIVAFYTLLDENGKQTQEMAYSFDAGYTFTKYTHNPIIDVDSKEFRDPKVFWFEPSQTWIMLTAMSKDYKVVFYGSKDLIDWERLSSFSSGYFANQFECPGLMQVPIEGSDETKWVLILAVNPGSPLGGSINQYFVGDFNGTHFIADDSQTRFLDIGKDFYAAQMFSNLPREDGVLVIGWASNWQYANNVPTHPWKSSMSLVRNFTLRYVEVNCDTRKLTLCQSPIMRGVTKKRETVFHNMTLSGKAYVGNILALGVRSSGLFDFEIAFTVSRMNLRYTSQCTFQLDISSKMPSSGKRDTLTIGFDAAISSFFVDRGKLSNAFSANPFFACKQSVYIEPRKGQEYRVYGVVDRNIMEIFFNDGSTTMTNTFFFGEGLYPHEIHLHGDARDAAINFESIMFRELKV